MEKQQRLKSVHLKFKINPNFDMNNLRLPDSSVGTVSAQRTGGPVFKSLLEQLFSTLLYVKIYTYKNYVINCTLSFLLIGIT